MHLQISLSLTSCHTTASCCYDSLTICWVTNITGSKDTLYVCTRCSCDVLDIPHFIKVNLSLEDISIRLMTDSKEESVNSNIILLFISLTLAIYKMHTFYAILSIKPNGIMLKENLDILCILDTLLHNLRCTEIVLADNKIYLLAKS